MAIKKCKECDNEVSTKAKSCPKCGAVKKSIAYEFIKLGCYLTVLWMLYLWYFPIDSSTVIPEDILKDVPKTYKLAPAKLSPAKLSPAKLSPAKLSPAKLAPIKTLPVLIECSRCKGTGLVKHGVRNITFRKCSRCKGSGKVKRIIRY